MQCVRVYVCMCSVPGRFQYELFVPSMWEVSKGRWRRVVEWLSCEAVESWYGGGGVLARRWDLAILSTYLDTLAMVRLP